MKHPWLCAYLWLCKFKTKKTQMKRQSAKMPDAKKSAKMPASILQQKLLTITAQE